MEPTKNTTGSRLQYRIDLILSVIFVAMIFFMGFMSAWDDKHGIRVAVQKAWINHGYIEDPDIDHELDPDVLVEKPVPDGYGVWNLIEDTIKALDSELAGNCYAHEELGYVNSGIQYALGKRMISTGSRKMITLNTGHLYDLQNYIPMEDAAEKIAAMRDASGDLPFLFVYEHPTIYSDEMMPEGYDVLDSAERIADEATRILREKGVEVMDSRDVLPDSFPELNEYLYRTDQHWSTRAAIRMAQEITGWLGENVDGSFDPARLDIDAFDTTLHEKLFMGRYGQRIGAGLIEPDDIVTYSPKYPTNIHRWTDYYGDITDVTGSFGEAVTKWKYLEPDEGRTWNLKAYFDYGLTEICEKFDSDGGADKTILLIKDSYAAPIGAFLSLTARHVVSVDLRHGSDKTLTDWIEEVKPDAVVVAYSMQMLRDDNYEFQ